jgi:hypothetical protein
MDTRRLNHHGRPIAIASPRLVERVSEDGQREA